MRALVTGSSGFVGRHMVAELHQRGYLVSCCDIKQGWDAMDIFRQGMTDCIQHYDLIVHAAAQAPHRAAIDGQPRTHIANQLLDAAIFDWAVRTGQGRVLYLSSCAVLDPAPDDYGHLKLAGERMAAQARRAGLQVTVVRPYSGYGEDQSDDFPFRALIERARRREDPFEIWGDGTQVRDWIHISDVVAGALAVVKAGVEEPVSLCTGVGTSMRGLAEMACSMVGYRPRFAFRTDKPAGVDYRVGDPAALHRFYVPKVSLPAGIERALASELAEV